MILVVLIFVEAILVLFFQNVLQFMYCTLSDFQNFQNAFSSERYFQGTEKSLSAKPDSQQGTSVMFGY
jgi:hypothetical protein